MTINIEDEALQALAEESCRRTWFTGRPIGHE
jgi:hypothetical protein